MSQPSPIEAALTRQQTTAGTSDQPASDVPRPDLTWPKDQPAEEPSDQPASDAPHLDLTWPKDQT